MNTDFRVSVGFQHNIKIRRLKKALGAAGPLCLIHIWGYAAQHFPEGTFQEVSRVELEAVAGWCGTAGRLVDTLLELRLIEEKDGEITIHEWAQHNGYASSARIRSDKARLAAMKRHHAQADAGADARAGETAYPPSPSPTPSPKPTPSYKNTDDEESPSVAPKKTRKPKEEPPVDHAWICEMSRSPAYENKDIWGEFDKMEMWISVHPGRKLTRKFAINWLNKAPDDPSIAAIQVPSARELKEIQDIDEMVMREEEEKYGPGGQIAYLRRMGKKF